MALSAAEQKEVDRVNELEYQKTLKTNPGAKRGEKEGDGIDTLAGTVNAKIESVKSTVQGKEPKEHDGKVEEEIVEAQKNPEKTEATVSSVAQLRDLANSTGTTVSTEQVAEARKAEEKTAEEGGKLHRGPASERGGKK